MNELRKKNLLPHGAEFMIEKWISPYSVEIQLKRDRKSKLGDYRRLRNHNIITINESLDKNLFFLTLTHEIAHLIAFSQFGKKIRPHGIEWKNTFSTLILESIEFYSSDFKNLMMEYSQNPKANLYSFSPLANYYNLSNNQSNITVCELEDQAVFRIGKRVFRKEKKRKIRYLCTDVNSGKKYLINGIAPIDEVIKIEE